MRQLNRDAKIMMEMQAELFEKSVEKTKTSSEVFVRRFMNSSVAREFDSSAILDDTKSYSAIFSEIEEEYGESSYGSLKYNKDVMYWCGYLYRYFSYVYELSSKQVYKYLPLKYVSSTFESFHTLDVKAAIDRLLEAKGIDLSKDSLIRKGVNYLKEHSYNAQLAKNI